VPRNAVPTEGFLAFGECVISPAIARHRLMPPVGHEAVKIATSVQIGCDSPLQF
jgi:hypothetical protein